MKNLIIIGARGYGREVFNLATQCAGNEIEYTIKGFLDDKKDALSGFTYPVGILSSVEDYIIEPNDVFVCALGSVVYKKKYVEIIKNKGGEFINLIHPTVLLHNNILLGKGLVMFGYSGISNDCVVGDFVTFQAYSTVGHDCIVGNWCHINAYSFIGGYAELEDEVTLHTRATILPKVKVGKGATVGAGSIVIKSVKPNTTVFGMPATQIF
jgi:sugar O-acyltransferase (sialic acid O-acetyltransferase NeuD family)